MEKILTTEKLAQGMNEEQLSKPELFKKIYEDAPLLFWFEYMRQVAGTCKDISRGIDSMSTYAPASNEMIKGELIRLQLKIEDWLELLNYKPNG